MQQYSKDITNSNLASETHLSSEYLAGFAVLKILQIGKIRFMNARIQLVHHRTTLMLHHIFELLHKHLHLQNSITILSSNNH